MKQKYLHCAFGMVLAFAFLHLYRLPADALVGSDGPKGDRRADDCDCVQEPGIRLRKNIDCFSAHELDVLKHAFDIVIARPVDDKTGYAYQVRIHGDPRVGPCEHGSELIWPWHRAFLYYFENLLRDSDPAHPTLSTKDLTLPYWDWTKPGSGPAGYPLAYESAPLAHQRQSYDTGNPPPLVSVDDIGIDLKPWYKFGGSLDNPGQLEIRPHNHVHSDYVRYDMAIPRISVQDPIFWAHHSNLDRLWDLWQAQNANDTTMLQDSMDTVLNGWPATNVPAPVVKNFLRSKEQLKVAYCNPKHERIALDLSGAARALTMTRAVDGAALRMHFQLPARAYSSVELRLNGVKTPMVSSYRARVFIYPITVDFRPEDPRFQATNLASTFTMWKMDHAKDEKHDTAKLRGTHPVKSNLYLDVTRSLRRLKGRGVEPGADLVVALDFVELPARPKGFLSKPTTYGKNDIVFEAASMDFDPPLPPRKAPK